MFVFALLFLCFFLFILERIITEKVWRKGIEVKLEFTPEVIEEGDKAYILEEYKNSKRLPLPTFTSEWKLSRLYGLYAPDGIPFLSSATFAFPGKTEVTRKKEINGLKRGIYTITDGKITSSDLFFSAEYSSSIYDSAKLIVLPRKRNIFLLSFPFRDFLGSVLSKKQSDEDPFEIRSIRSYVPTDSMRTINWKASAKTGELKVNQWEWTTDESVVIIADFSSGNEEEGEILIEYISAFASLLLKRGIAVSLATNGRSAIAGKRVEVGNGSGSSHSRAIDLALSEIKLISGESMALDCLLEKVFSSPLHAVPALFSVSLREEGLELYNTFSKGEGYSFTLKGNSSHKNYVIGAEDD